MANTTNLNLSKLAGTEKLKSFPSPYNDNMEAIDGAFGAGFGVSGKPSVNAELNSLADGLAIIANGNTHAAITSGQYVYVRGHGTLADGLYQATANIAQDETLSGSNLTADSSGGLNSVYSALNGKIKQMVAHTVSVTTDSSGTAYLGIASSTPIFGVSTDGSPVSVFEYSNKWYILHYSVSGGNVVPVANVTKTITYYTFE